MLCFILIAVICFNFEIRIFYEMPIYISLPFTILWITGIINAINIIDNMDGLSSGISSISLFFICIVSYNTGNANVFISSLCLLGACIGFLLFNFNPAKIFMGDSGSLFIGLIISILSLQTSGTESNIFSTLLVPTMLLLIPIFDTTLVTVNRILNNKPISKGGTDHISHRLVSFGMSEKNVVLFLYLMSALFGLIAIIFRQYGIREWSLIFLIIISGLGITGLFISYYKSTVPENLKFDKSQNFVFNTVVFYKKQILEVLFDSILIAMCFTFAHYLRYEDNVPIDIWVAHDKIIGWLICCKILVFYFFGLYKGIWKYASVSDLINCLKASAVGSATVVILIMFFYRDISFSRSIYFIDFLLTFLTISGFRLFYRIFAELMNTSNLSNKSEKTLIVGAGQLGQLVLRRIFDEESNFNYYPVGLIDNKVSLRGRNLFDVPILGNLKDYPKIITEYNISTVLCTVNNKSVLDIKEFCKKKKIIFRQISIDI